LSERKYTLEMIGEALREAGILVIVFTLLYEIVETPHANWIMVVLGVVVGIGLLLGGIKIERERKI
jgi:hypothetical protein